MGQLTLFNKFPVFFLGTSGTQFRAERIKIPPIRYPRATGSDKGTVQSGSNIYWYQMLLQFFNILCHSRLAYTFGG